jgi:DNA-binding transcriptional LysR family regulator
MADEKRKKKLAAERIRGGRDSESQGPPAAVPSELPTEISKDKLVKMQGITLEKLMNFVSSAEHGQIKAAKQRGTGQSNISKAETLLEEICGRLYEGSATPGSKHAGEKRSLTLRGRRLEGCIRDLLDVFHELARGQTICLGYSRPALPLVAHVVAKLSKHFTFHVEELESSQIADRLARGSLDIGVAYAVPAFDPLTTKSVVQRKRKGGEPVKHVKEEWCRARDLYESPLLLLMPKSYEKQPLSKLQELTYMTFDPALSTAHTDALKGWLKARGVLQYRGEKAVVRAGQKTLYVAMKLAFGFTPAISCDPRAEELGITQYVVPELPRAPLRAYYLFDRRDELEPIVKSLEEHAQSAFRGLNVPSIGKKRNHLMPSS